MLDAHAPKQNREQLALFNADGTHKNWLAGLVDFFDFLTDGLELELLVVIDKVGEVFAYHRLVRRDDHHIKIVDFQEFRCFGVGGTGHTADLVIHAEEVLEGNSGQRLVLSEDLDFLLGFYSLVQPVAVPSAMENAAGELVDNLDLAVDHHVIDVIVIESERLHRLGDIVNVFKVLIGINRTVYDMVLVQQLFHVQHPLVGEGDFLLFFIKFVVAALLKGLGVAVEAGKGVLLVVVTGLGILLTLDQGGCDFRSTQYLGRVVLALAADDQGGSGFVDENRVDFVDDAIVMLGLDFLLGRPLHVVPEVVEAEFVVRTIRYIPAVCSSLGLIVHIREDDSHRKPQKLVYGSHP